MAQEKAAKDKQQRAAPANEGSSADACADVCRRGQTTGSNLANGDKLLYRICFEGGFCTSGTTLKKVYDYKPPGSVLDPLRRLLPSGSVI
jgi:hypothetical protein